MTPQTLSVRRFGYLSIVRRTFRFLKYLYTVTKKKTYFGIKKNLLNYYCTQVFHVNATVEPEAPLSEGYFPHLFRTAERNTHDCNIAARNVSTQATRRP